jgi:hypothetical protein
LDAAFLATPGPRRPANTAAAVATLAATGITICLFLSAWKGEFPFCFSDWPSSVFPPATSSDALDCGSLSAIPVSPFVCCGRPIRRRHMGPT